MQLAMRTWTFQLKDVSILGSGTLTTDAQIRFGEFDTLKIVLGCELLEYISDTIMYYILARFELKLKKFVAKWDFRKNCLPLSGRCWRWWPSISWLGSSRRTRCSSRRCSNCKDLTKSKFVKVKSSNYAIDLRNSERIWSFLFAPENLGHFEKHRHFRYKIIYR